MNDQKVPDMTKILDFKHDSNPELTARLVRYKDEHARARIIVNALFEIDWPTANKIIKSLDDLDKDGDSIGRVWKKALFGVRLRQLNGFDSEDT